MTSANPLPPSAPKKPAGWRPRFGLLSLLLVTTLFAVGSAVLGYLLRSGSDSANTAIYVILATAAPMGTMILASVIKAIGEYQDRKARKHRRAARP